MDLIRYALAWLLVVFLPPAVLYWYAVHPFASLWRRIGRGAGLVAGFSALGVSALLLGFAAPRLLRADFGFSWPLTLLGVAAIVGAGMVARQRRKQLTTRILLGVPEVAADPGASRLLTEGIYARLRHPRYVEVVLGATGYALVANYLAGYVVVAASVLLMVPLIIMEERELHRRFGGAWEEYARRTPRFLPRRPIRAVAPPPPRS